MTEGKILVWYSSNTVWVKITDYLHGTSKNSDKLRFMSGNSFEGYYVNNKITQIFFFNLHLNYKFNH